jgi:hypothetical protein
MRFTLFGQQRQIPQAMSGVLPPVTVLDFRANISQIDGPRPSASGDPSICAAALAAPQRKPTGIVCDIAFGQDEERFFAIKEGRPEPSGYEAARR